MSIVKVRNCYLGSKQLDPIALGAGGGGIKAAYLGNVMVYGEYEEIHQEYIVNRTTLDIRFFNGINVIPDTKDGKFISVDYVDLSIGDYGNVDRGKYKLTKTYSTEYYPAGAGEVIRLCETQYYLGDSYNEITLSIMGTIKLSTTIPTSKFKRIDFGCNGYEKPLSGQPNFDLSFPNTTTLTISSTNHIYRTIVSQLYLDIYF